MCAAKLHENELKNRDYCFCGVRIIHENRNQLHSWTEGRQPFRYGTMRAKLPEFAATIQRGLEVVCILQDCADAISEVRKRRKLNKNSKQLILPAFFERASFPVN